MIYRSGRRNIVTNPRGNSIARLISTELNLVGPAYNLQLQVFGSLRWSLILAQESQAAKLCKILSQMKIYQNKIRRTEKVAFYSAVSGRVLVE